MYENSYCERNMHNVYEKWRHVPKKGKNENSMKETQRKTEEQRKRKPNAKRVNKPTKIPIEKICTLHYWSCPKPPPYRRALIEISTCGIQLPQKRVPSKRGAISVA